MSTRAVPIMALTILAMVLLAATMAFAASGTFVGARRDLSVPTVTSGLPLASNQLPVAEASQTVPASDTAASEEPGEDTDGVAQNDPAAKPAPDRTSVTENPTAPDDSGSGADDDGDDHDDDDDREVVRPDIRDDDHQDDSEEDDEEQEEH